MLSSSFSGIKGESLLKLSQLFLIERAREKKKVEKEDDGKQSRHSPALPY
jgi:hypothetical protein